MPLEIRELVVRVTVSPSDMPAAPVLDASELAVLKRDLVAACLAELRLRGTEQNER